MAKPSLLRTSGVAVLSLAALASSATRDGRLREHTFSLSEAAEVVAVIQASCAECAWDRSGYEAAVVKLLVDGRYSQHVALVRGAVPAAYRVSLGILARGPHRLSVAADRRLTAPGIRQVEVSGIETEAVIAGSPRYQYLAHSPILHTRPNALERFSDVPLVMWVEQEPMPDGLRLRYSVVFSNEDGGTPSDRLMATWGRLTDIEYVYGVELDAAGRIIAAQYQGRDHEIRRFAGVREGGHPLLYVVTDNNMLSDRGPFTQRIALEAVPFDLTGVSREAVMDAQPWTYRVSSEEARREGRVAAGAQPGDGRIPDPRRFAYLEACAETTDAVLTFGVGVASPEGTLRFFDSDGGQPSFRIARSADHFPNGCFRGAVALPEGTRPVDIRVLQMRAFTRAPRKGEPPLPKGAGAARLRRVNALFLLGADDLPGPRLFSWAGDVLLPPEGPAQRLEMGGEP